MKTRTRKLAPKSPFNYTYEWTPKVPQKHDWNEIERWADGKLWKIHACILDHHEKPVLEPFEIVMLSPAEEALMETRS